MLPHGRTPTHEHELIVTLFHDDPHLVVDLLRLVFGIEIPEDVKAGPDDTTLSKPAPAVYSSDGVVAWERFMEVPEGYKYQSDFAKKYYGQGHTEGMKQGTEAAGNPANARPAWRSAASASGSLLE